MDRGNVPPLRSLPRVFLPGLEPEAPTIELPEEELKKLTKVLRMSSGDQLAVLRGDGRLLRCELRGREAVILETIRPETEARTKLTLCQALPRAEKLEEVVRMGTEMGVSKFVMFPSDRSVVKWDASKLQEKLRRLASIAREAAEVAFRTHLPELSTCGSLKEALGAMPDALVLSEVEGVQRKMTRSDIVVLVVGPEGGWSPREVELIGDRAITLGPRVLRVDTAAAAACALVLLG